MNSASSPEPPADDFEALLASCIDLVQSRGPGALEAACSAHPEHADRLRRQVAYLARAGLLEPARVEDPAAPAFPERLGGFRLLRELGAGGMGVVYLAEEEALERRVALKLIRPEQLYFAGARERFRREVQIVAGLQHPGIVPVYQVGEEAGIPYFAMELVDGASLDAVLQHLGTRDPAHLSGGDLARALGRASSAASPVDATSPLFRGSWVEACLRVALAAAEATEYAHQRGVLHRDIKPSNLMLTADGRVRLVDFGVSSSQADVRITRTGALVGSLLYMAPERVRGEESDARSDVYALGVTLYEMLALEAPFHAETALDAQTRILAGRPPALRERNPRVTPDAETVCLKAIDRDAERRYATVAEFAADVARVLAFEPIAARRTGPLLRLRRWSQRNPALAVGAVLGTLLVIGLPTALYVQEQRSNQRLTLTNAELDATNARLGASLDREASERQRAEANLSRALDSVNTMLTSVADRLRNVPGMESVRRELVDKALRVTHELEQQAELAGPHRRQLAELYLTRATLLGVLGETEEGLDSMRVALEQFEAARAELPGDLATLSSYANALYRLSPILTNLGQHEEALAALTQAAQLYAEADALEASGSTARMGLLSTLRLSAEAAARLGDRGGAIALLEDLLGATDALADGEASFDERLLLVDLNEALGMQYVMAGRRSAARAPYSAAWKQLQLCTAENATSVEARKATVALAHRFGPLLCDLGALEAGEDVLRRGLALARETLQQFPGEWYNDYEVAELLRALGAALSERQAWEAVEACFGESYERFAGLTQRLPLIAGLRSKLGYLLSDWASAYRDQGRLDEALDAADRAIEEHRAVIGLATAAEGTGMRALLGQALVRRGAILADLDEPSAAAEAIAEALTHSPEDPFAFRQSAKVLARCVAAAADGERAHFVDAAFAAIERALELGLEHPADLIEDERLQPLHADPRFAELRARVALD